MYRLLHGKKGLGNRGEMQDRYRENEKGPYPFERSPDTYFKPYLQNGRLQLAVKTPAVCALRFDAQVVVCWRPGYPEEFWEHFLQTFMLLFEFPALFAAGCFAYPGLDGPEAA